MKRRKSEGYQYEWMMDYGFYLDQYKVQFKYDSGIWNDHLRTMCMASTITAVSEVALVKLTKVSTPVSCLMACTRLASLHHSLQTKMEEYWSSAVFMITNILYYINTAATSNDLSHA